MMGNEYAGRVAAARKGRSDEVHLFVADPAVLEGQRPCRVDAEHDCPVELVVGAKRVVDVALVAGQRRQETTQDVVERNIVVAGDSEDLVTGILQPGQEPAGLLELVGTRSLREIAADNHEVGFCFVDPGLDRLDEVRFVCPEMKVGQVDQPGHRARTRCPGRGSPPRR